MKRAFGIVSAVILLVLAALLHTSIKDFLWTHPWLHSALVAIPTIALAYFELRHSGEANRLRGRIADLEEERNRHLQQIAENTRRRATQAERNASLLRRYLRAKAKVSEGQGNWGESAEIVEVSEDNIATLFVPKGFLTSIAFCVHVRCDELEVTEVPEGACAIRVKVLRRYGQDVQLGEITKWEDRLQSPATPTVSRGPNVYHAMYGKPGIFDVRSLNVYGASDGRNSFTLEASPGEILTGDNIEISKRFMLLQIEWEAAGFSRRNSGSGGSLYPLFIKT